MSLSEAAGAPLFASAPDLILSPLTLGDLAEFESWANTIALEEAKAKIAFVNGSGGALSQDEKNLILLEAFNSTKNGVAAIRASTTLEGTRLFLFLSLKRRKPDVTKDQIAELVTTENRQHIAELLDSMLGAAPPNAQPAASPDSGSTLPESTGPTPTTP